MGKIKVRFFTIADYEEEEAWLRTQHQNGLRLVKFVVPCFFVFEECTPQDMIYRLDFKNGEQREDYLQMFRDYGWEYVTSCVGWLYFRKAASEVQAENDGEIFSDGETKVAMIQHIMRTRMFPIAAVFLCCVVPGWICTITGGAFYLKTGFILFSVLLLLYIYLIAHCGGKLRKLRKKYQCK